MVATRKQIEVEKEEFPKVGFGCYRLTLEDVEYINGILVQRRADLGCQLIIETRAYVYDSIDEIADTEGVNPSLIRWTLKDQQLVLLSVSFNHRDTPSVTADRVDDEDGKHIVEYLNRQCRFGLVAIWTLCMTIAGLVVYYSGVSETETAPATLLVWAVLTLGCWLFVAPTTVLSCSLHLERRHKVKTVREWFGKHLSEIVVGITTSAVSSLLTYWLTR